MSEAPYIEVANAAKQFSRSGTSVAVFDELSLSVSRGAFVALMGPSGSGKTTLLHAIGGLERLTAGTIRVGDQQIAQESESRLAEWRARTIGFVFQFYNLMPMLTAEENIELPLLLTTLSAADRRRRVATAADLVGISHRLRHRPQEMSGGEQQRVAIARAIVADPPLLLCDEPTGDLDRATSDEVLEILRTLSNDSGKTIIMVTHDPAAATCAERLFRFNKGELEAS